MALFIEFSGKNRENSNEIFDDEDKQLVMPQREGTENIFYTF